jgi:hypothetical protein
MGYEDGRYRIIQEYDLMFYGYKIGEDGIEFTLFGFVLFRLIAFSSISDISIEKALALRPRFNPFTTLRLGNAFRLRMVVVLCHSGWIRTILLTPENPEEFVANVKNKLAAMQAYR